MAHLTRGSDHGFVSCDHCQFGFLLGSIVVNTCSMWYMWYTCRLHLLSRAEPEQRPIKSVLELVGWCSWENIAQRDKRSRSKADVRNDATEIERALAQ